MKINKELAIIGNLIVLSVLISSYATAFAVSSTYWSENPLKLFPGEARDFQLTLQNLAGSEDITLKATISKSSEIISIADSGDTYEVPLGTKAKVNLRASIPNSAEVGDIYPFEIIFATATESESGTFSLGSSIKQGFNVIVVEKPKPAEEILPQEKPETNTLTLVIIAVAAIALIILVIIILKRRRKEYRESR